MLYSKNSRIASAAFLLLIACCMTDIAMAGEPDGRGGATFAGVPFQWTPRLPAMLDERLPLEPRLPDHRDICSTLKADLAAAAFASPSATDPAVDSMAAVAASPLNSNPDTVRIQA